MKTIFYLILLSCATAFGFDDSWVVVDSEDASVEIVGEWTRRHLGQGYDGTYDHDGNVDKGTKSVRLTPDLPTASNYNVYLNWVSNNNRASNAPVTITHGGGSTTVYINQREAGDWVLLGTFSFAAGTAGSVLIETTDTDGYVIADAAAWEAVDGDIEIPEINVFTSVSETTEGDASHPAILTLTRSGPTNLALNIALDVAGSATPIDDYTAIAEANLFPVGESTRTFLVTPFDDGVAEGDETIVVSVLADDGYMLGSNTAAQVVIKDSPMDVWRAEKFTATELANLAVSSSAADPDEDGDNNLGEFFADTNPKVADAGPKLWMGHDGTNMLVHLPRSPAAAELEVGLKTSADLNSWWPVSQEIIAVVENDMLTYAIPDNEDVKQFWGASIEQRSIEKMTDGIAFWSFDSAFDGTGSASELVTYVDGFASGPILSTAGTAHALGAGGAENYFGPDGNSWFGGGHSLTWSAGSVSNQFSIEFSSFLQEDIHIRFDLLSSVSNFSALSYDTGTGPLPVPAADLGITADGQFHEWALNLSAMDAVNGRSSVTLTWAFEDLLGGTEEMVKIDNIVVSLTGRAKSKLIRNLEAGRLQTVVALGTSITANGAWVGLLSDSLDANYHGLATVLNSGASGKTSAHGVTYVDSLVLQKAPDTMFIEYSINDCVERFAMSVADAQANLEYIIDTTLANFPQCEIILMTMTPGDKYDPGEYSYRKDIQDYYAMYRAVARERGFMAIDHYSSWIALQTNDVSQFNSYVPDSIHPGDEGNAVVVSPVVIHSLGIVAED